MTDFKFHSKPSVFKLGIVERTNTGLQLFKPDFQIQLPNKPNKPIIIPKPPEPNIYFTPIQDNQDQVLERMKKNLEFHLEATKNILSTRF